MSTKLYVDKMSTKLCVDKISTQLSIDKNVYKIVYRQKCLSNYV